jgi:hypothetical protein
MDCFAALAMTVSKTSCRGCLKIEADAGDPQRRLSGRNSGARLLAASRMMRVVGTGIFEANEKAPHWCVAQKS